jgi:hypothetical protein
MGAQIPVIAEKPLATCGCRKFQLDPLGDHLNTCTAHSGVKKTHDWTVDQMTDLFRTTRKVKTQQVIKSLGHHCGDIELAGYLTNTTGLVPLLLDLRIASMTVTGVVLTDLTTTITLLILYHLCLLLMVRLGGYVVNLSDFYSYRLIGKLTVFLQLQEFSLRNLTVTSSTSAAWLSLHSSKAGLTWFSLRLQLLRITLNLDGTPITSKSHTHPSHSQTFRLLTSSLSLGVPVPRATQSM